MHTIVVGLSIKRAPIEILEQLSVHHSQNALCVQDVKAAAGLAGAVVLSTCNRLEFYGVCEDADEGVARVRDFIMGQGKAGDAVQERRFRDLLYAYADDCAVRHLFEVVCGLDSLIVGETEVAGQVSRAYQASCKAGANDKIINVWFQRALSLGKKVRSETRISRYSTSIGRIAVDLAVRELGGIADKRVLILGAGEMSELTMKYLVAQDVSVAMVSNRSLDKAQRLAGQYGFGACSLDEMDACLEQADVVFSATAAKGCLVDKARLAAVMARRPARPLLCIDMGLPRDIDPEVRSIPNVSCYDINELRDVANRHQNERLRAAKNAARLIDEAAADFERWQRSLEYLPTIDALYRQAERIKADKLERAMGKLSGLTPSQKNVVQCLATSITHQLMHEPVASLNAMAGSEKSRAYAAMLEELFHLQPEGEPARAEAGAEGKQTGGAQ
ncbi:glutamyl-tRNA reductase [Gordonibacter massiliensis (ex Traore et al. 2017)]|uniref:glutamyl-tRNA reductase n=1 Tax=Gordonibacter massiliensis (ex Traore et al. 2017) TaxID=1841863 RepID=UPI001C8C243A|nr:glutamyl-tRNA reductase [Gordonibacter massiliensis (ex Traore et al. 2017)]MBX9034896.1 glutamyl-tRNA reductase [Gordonibacter massiliensis (ex Traore et al. 2017)]